MSKISQIKGIYFIMVLLFFSKNSFFFCLKKFNKKYIDLFFLLIHAQINLTALSR